MKYSKQKWVEDDIVFLKNNYPKFGPKKLSQLLNKKESTINSKLKTLKLRGQKNKKYEKINFSFLIPEDLYIMGFIWADGYLHDYKNRLELCMSTDDFRDIENIFDKKNWSIIHRKRSDKKKLSTTLGIYNKETCDLFRGYGYSEKSLINPNFINEIPKDLRHYFFRGFFDGDGCFYVSKDGLQKQCYFAGSYEQKWCWIETLLDDLNIEYNIKKKTQKNGYQKYSIVYIKRKFIKKFGDFIYQNFENDKIGLLRKYDKFLKIKGT